MVTARIDKTLLQKAKNLKLNISESIEEVLKNKTEDVSKSTLVLQIEKYGISLIPNNWVVGRLSNAFLSQAQGVGKDFYDTGTQTYHSTLHQALIQLSKRLLEDKIKTSCKERPIDLNELLTLIEKHHEYFIDLVKGI